MSTDREKALDMARSDRKQFGTGSSCGMGDKTTMGRIRVAGDLRRLALARGLPRGA